jgi:hypothetical protein
MTELLLCGFLIFEMQTVLKKFTKKVGRHSSFLRFARTFKKNSKSETFAEHGRF